jgi:pimeloyl-ACP methyl ester carboxylesterase
MTSRNAVRDVRVGDATLRVESQGDGQPVVMHPSLGRWSRDFDLLTAALVGAGFTTITIDPRGIGDSSGPLDAVTLRSCADDVVAVIGALELTSVHLVGHAFGSRVMRQVASDRHDLVRSIVLLGAGGKVHGDEEARRAVGRCFELDLPEEERFEAVRTAFFAPGNDPRVWSDGWFPAAKAAQQDALVGADLAQWWLGGIAPMLIVQGVQDRAAPPANGRLLQSERKAPTQRVEVDGAGHALLPEQPEAIAAHVLAFLRDVEEFEGRR